MNERCSKCGRELEHDEKTGGLKCERCDLLWSTAFPPSRLHPSAFPSPPPGPRLEPKFSIAPGRATNAVTASLMAAALTSSWAISQPLERTIVQGVLVLVVHLVGLFQPRPR